MYWRLASFVCACMALGPGGMAFADESPGFSAERSAAAEKNYLQYCALCHGADRQGYVNDHAPSLKSDSLMASAFPEVIFATAYGRFGTPMAGYVDDVGGPMTMDEIRDLTIWLVVTAGVDIVSSDMSPVQGDIRAGAEIYARDCAECHGAKGEGGNGTALGNAAMLSLTTDKFLRYAIENGRNGTAMVAFRDKLSSADIDAVTAFLRSRATGWAVEAPVLRSPPTADSYIINPDGRAPQFDLQDGRYVMAADLLDALRDGRKMVILDTRATSMWQMVNIEGSVPLPYYYDSADALMTDLPRDGTMIVTYCECPRAAADFVRDKLAEHGFDKLAVLYEGIGGWVSLGYPVSRGKTISMDAHHH